MNGYAVKKRTGSTLREASTTDPVNTMKRGVREKARLHRKAEDGTKIRVVT